MLRSELDRLAAQHRLSTAQIRRALALTGNHPDANAWRQFAIALLRAAGVAGIGAGAIFFVAANWQDYGVMGRFLLLQVGFVVSVGVALWRPPASDEDAAKLFCGGLFALFGQTYQTGADVYELFFIWALLTLPFAIAAMSGALWATWWCVLNIALALYCGWSGPTDLAWAFFDRWGLNKSAALMMPFAVDLGGAMVVYALADIAATNSTIARFAQAAPAWLARMLLVFAFVFGTSACVFVIAPDLFSFHGHRKAAMNTGVLAAFFLASIGVIIFTLKQRRDVFPLAIVAGSFILISTVFIVKSIARPDIGTAILIAAWLIGTSTAAAFVLMRYVREWRTSGTARAGLNT
jgi:uncharacterized membrane protein